MATHGRLTKAGMRSNLPTMEPGYLDKPLRFKQVRTLRFDYRTDAEVVADLIPEQLNLPDDPTAFLSFFDYGFSTLGPYQEAVLGVNVQYKGRDMWYPVQLMMTTAVPIMVGREVYGYPKKLGFVGIKQFEDTLCGYVERPEGERLATGILRIEEPFEPCPKELHPAPQVTIRPVPDPVSLTGHSRIDLLLCEPVTYPTQIWAAKGQPVFSGLSAIDVWDCVPVVEPLGANYLEGDVFVPGCEILETF